MRKNQKTAFGHRLLGALVMFFAMLALVGGLTACGNEGSSSTGGGISESVEEGAEGVEEGAEGAEEGVEEGAEGAEEGVEEGAEGVEEGTEESGE